MGFRILKIGVFLETWLGHDPWIRVDTWIRAWVRAAEDGNANSQVLD